FPQVGHCGFASACLRWDHSCSCKSLLLPAGLGYAGNFATHGDFTELASGEAELAVNAARSTGQRATVAQAHRAAVSRQLLQFVASLGPIFVGSFAVVYDGVQLDSLGREFLHGCTALLLAVDQRSL